MRFVLVAALAVMLVSGCARDASPRGRDRTPYEELEARTPEVLGAIDRLAVLLRGTAGDCPRIASELRRFGDRRSATMAELAELKRRLTAAERERFELDHFEDAARLDPVMAAVRPCAGDPAVEAAMTTAGFRAGR
jgi:hypothetical protein